MGLKLNGKMKRRIRKAVAGVCLVSSVMVAAIPADYSGIAQGAGDVRSVSAANIDDHEPLNYADDISLSRNGDFTSNDNPYLNYTSKEIRDHNMAELYSYEIIRNSDGLWSLRWMYKYFVPTDDPAYNSGIIIGFNKNNGIEQLTIRATVTPGYMIVSTNAFAQVCRNLSDPKWTWSVTGDPSNYDHKDLDVYFPGTYEQWVADYNAYISTEGNNGADFSRSVSGNEMPDVGRFRWYCDQPGTVTPSGGGHEYTLVRVLNSAKNMPYKPSNDASIAIMPEDGYVYVVQYEGNASHDQIYRDENGFLNASITEVNAIGQGAFADSGVTEMTVSGNIQYIGDEAFHGNVKLDTVSLLGVLYIGNRVFKDCSELKNVTLSDSIGNIGKEAFSGCNMLETLHIPNGIENIGFGAFSNCNGLKSVDMSGSTKTTVSIGEYAFYNCEKLENITFNDTYYTFGKAAFAVAQGSAQARSLTSFSFPMIGCYKPVTGESKWQDENYINGEGYRLYDENGDPYTSYLGDYLFAGRGTGNLSRPGLTELVLPENFTGTSRVPMNTLSRCTEFQKLVFSDSSINATYDSVLFRDVVNTKLCVYGPGFSGSLPSGPRMATWQAKPGSGLGYVPYIYKTSDGKEHYEVGVDYYRYDLEVDQDNNTATIVDCQFTDLAFEAGNGSISANTVIDLVIPGKVATYTITALGPNCFASSYRNEVVKNYVRSITIMDDSIQVIGKEVFSGYPKLVSANIGNSVETIDEKAFSDNKLLETVTIGGGIETVGEEAFAGCPELTDVIWKTPNSYNTQVEIADNAFITGGQKGLYFEGDIAIGYGPFDYAMEDETISGGQSHYINGNGTRICYRSSGPNYYYVIRDEETNENLLIDYPHYSDLPQDVRDRYERKPDPTSPVSGNYVPTPQDIQLVNETRQLIIPEAVTSIDVKSFYLSTNVNNENQGSWIYIDALKNPNASEGLDISCKDLYSNDNLMLNSVSGNGLISGNGSLQDFYQNSGGYHSGLFSGYYVDRTPLIVNEDDPTQLDIKGNDWIISIEMPGVTSIPEYAFDSCENLQGVILSDACEEIAPTAFQNCNKLRTISVTGNYNFDNYILYKVLSDGTYEIATCLQGRGLIENGATDLWVNTANDPNLSNVSKLAAGAFEDCAKILSIDLSDTSIVEVPQNTFKNCSDLGEVILPDTRNMVIRDNVFRGNKSPLNVTIPNVMNISDTAFDPDLNHMTTIWTYPETAFITGTYLTTDNNGNTVNTYKNIYVQFIDSAYTVKFLYDDFTLYEERTVENGDATYAPEVDPTPKLEVYSGYIFDGWKYYYGNEPREENVAPSNALQKVTSNLIAIAQFKPNPQAATFTITFRNDDYSVFETKTVAAGNNGLVPSTFPSPKLTEHQGWYFSHWNFYDSTLGLENVTENRNAVAVFSAVPVSGNGAGGGSQNGGSGSGGSNGNNGSNGSNGNNGGNGGNGSDGTNGNNGSASGNSVSNNAGKYNVIVENGAGGGYYAPGSVVTITAYAAPSGKVFDRWTTSNTDIGFSNAFGASTTFIMPTHEVKVTATYRTPSASSNRVSQNSTTNGTTNNNNSNNNNSSGVTRNPNRNGTDVTVTTSTIDNNNKNLASATVSGSTDNFVVKITDSAAAYAAVEQALRAQYGDLSNVKFVGFDISLYDETGTRKIENTSGLAVNITIPIPDDLVPYAGNNMAAGVVNGVLAPMTVKFTTIDGVPCMQFTATHFSPYAIYVNTNNLVSGVTDTTPKTGDIHPKWFLAIGLACISGILFMWKDKKKVAV